MQINRNNYEEFFLLYVDGELSADDREAVERFATANPGLLDELNMLKETVLSADHEIIFEHKNELYKKENKIIPAFLWWRVAATILLILGVGLWGWLYLDRTENSERNLSTTTRPEQQAPPASGTSIHPEKEIATGTPSSEQKTVTPRAASAYLQDIRPDPHVPEKTDLPPVAEQIKLDLTADIPTALIEQPDEEVSVKVVPQKIIAESVPVEKQTVTYEYVDPVDDDMIYFANTTLPKRSKFREVFRKASRIVERATSIQ